MKMNDLYLSSFFFFFRKTEKKGPLYVKRSVCTDFIINKNTKKKKMF